MRLLALYVFLKKLTINFVSCYLLQVKVPPSCCGKPEVVGDKACCDDGGFFAFDDSGYTLLHG